MSGFLPQLFNKITGIPLGPDIEQTANDYANGLRPFTGTLSDLRVLIANEVNGCTEYVMNNTLTASTPDAIRVCQSAVNRFYQSDIEALSQQQLAVDQAVNQSIIANLSDRTMYIVAGCIILIIIILLII